MTKYKVTFQRTCIFVTTVVVRADSPEQAENLASDTTCTVDMLAESDGDATDEVMSVQEVTDDE